MKAPSEETQPKVQEQQQQQQSQRHRNTDITKQTMKFNWRANWEILLVLLIIVVGIVITTIAAIRNKDKHLLVLSEEADYGQLSTNNDGLADHQHHVPPLPQTDYQLNNAHATSSSEDDGGKDRTIDNASSVNSKRAARPKSNIHKQNGNGGSVSGGRAKANAQQKLANGNRQAHLSKQDEHDFSAFSASISSSGSFEPVHDSYDALGTEPTPSQTRRDQNAPKSTTDQGQQRRRAVSNLTRPPSVRPEDNQERPLVESDDQTLSHLVDDIHTTLTSFPPSKSTTNFVTESSVLSSIDSQQMTPSLSLHGPYGLMLPALVGGANQQQQQQNRSKQATTTEAPLADYTDDMMVSYSRNPRNNLSSSPAPISVNITSEDLTLGGREQVPGRKHRGGQAAAGASAHHSMPFSVLLNDLIKLSRSNSLINPQANLDKPANSRPQYSGILQQLRSLPGPVLALLQGSSLSSSSGSGGGGGGGNSGGGSYSDFRPMTQTHDASESSQHYQQIPISSSSGGMHAFGGGSNPLPAFPPPKGTPSIWYPPTMGGNPSVHDAMNSNADFIASNVAGFVRSPNSAAAGGGGTRPAGSAASELTDSQYPNTDEAQSVSHQRQSNDMPPAQINGANLQAQQYNSVQQQQQQQSSQHANNLVLIHAVQQNSAGAPSRASSSLPASASAPIFNNLHRPISEIQQVPLGYSSHMQQQQQQQQQIQPMMRHQYDFNGLPSESAPKASLASSGSYSSGKVATGTGTAPASGPQPAKLQQAQGLNHARRRRAIENAQISNAEMDEEEELLDSRPVSIVQPDGRPMSSPSSNVHRRVPKRRAGYKNDERAPNSQRQVNQLDLDQSALHHYAAQQNAAGNPSAIPGERAKPNEYNQRHYVQKNGQAKVGKNKFVLKNKRRKLNGALEVAGSGLKSKLLGLASTSDELEEDFDGDDEESANERRKEELDDAEFGIVNERPNSLDSGADDSVGGGGGDDVSRLVDNGNTAPESSKDSDSSVSSGSTDKESYTRRNQQQQRADVEFYGHPGEETRQLKYGILGSGNYEVVNGGIYPEADESTAAVNSLAHYVRKPGGLLAGLSKFAISSGGSNGGLHSLDQTSGPQAAAYMPGGRIAGAYMRGASANPDEMLNFVPSAGVTPDLKSLPNPLLDLIDANGGHLFDPSLIAHLGSSGTSARTTFVSKEQEQEDDVSSDAKRELSKQRSQFTQSGHEDDTLKTKHGKRKRKNGNLFQAKPSETNPDKNEQKPNAEVLRHQFAANENQSSPANSVDGQQLLSGERTSQKTNKNPFYSYQILPSKMVKIYSDQDLDSAPSERRSRIY